MGKVIINQGSSIPWTFRFIGVILVFAGIILFTQNFSEEIAVPVAIVLSLLMPMIWFSKSILIIDNSNKEIHEGVWLLGYKTGTPRKFSEIEKFYINKVKTSQQMYSHANVGHTSKGIEFQAYIKLDDGAKFFLTSDKNEKRLEEKVTKIREKLGMS